MVTIPLFFNYLLQFKQRYVVSIVKNSMVTKNFSFGRDGKGMGAMRLGFGEFSLTPTGLHPPSDGTRRKGETKRKPGVVVMCQLRNVTMELLKRCFVPQHEKIGGWTLPLTRTNFDSYLFRYLSI
ncbi:hypothetical protein B0I10_1151 [Flavobacterium lacus]|uniref:Uncharacterized protein n=1 Tax=Flavobacterium lacus TaxID=1353778 RepID=A0A328WN27_9FLAO|nr:hypothetical protein B0I10_1151 [Flavobacterium lacus]